MRQTWLSWRSIGARGRNQQSKRGAIARTNRPLGERLEDRRLLAAMTELASASLGDLSLDTSSYRPTSLLVQYRDAAAAANSSAGSIAGTRLTSDWAIAPGLRKVELDVCASLDAALAAYRSDPNVLF